MRDIIFMKCNCVSQGTSKGKPACLVHDTQEQIPAPNLTGRKASCTYCKKTVDSKGELAFFRYLPDKDRDEYYDGCMGWD